MYSPIQSFSLLPVYLPLVKGTSVENERVSVLERVMEVVLVNESNPGVNVVN